jgi:hypothetical protein
MVASATQDLQIAFLQPAGPVYLQWLDVVNMKNGSIMLASAAQFASTIVVS